MFLLHITREYYICCLHSLFCGTHHDDWYEVREGVPEVGVVPEHMVGEQWRDGVAADSCIEHQDQYTDICTHPAKESLIKHT